MGWLLKGNFKRTSSDSLRPLGVHNNDLDAASQTLRAKPVKTVIPPHFLPLGTLRAWPTVIP